MKTKQQKPKTTQPNHQPPQNHSKQTMKGTGALFCSILRHSHQSSPPLYVYLPLTKEQAKSRLGGWDKTHTSTKLNPPQ